MEGYLWLFSRNENRALAGSILSSLLFHVLMIAILASTHIFHFTVGDSEKIDVLWFYPSASSGRQKKPAVKVSLAQAKKAEPVSLQNKKSAEPLSEKIELSQALPAGATSNDPDAERKPPPPSPPVSESSVKPIVTVPEDEEMEPGKEPEMKIPALIEPLPKIETVEHKSENSLINKAATAETKKAFAAEPETKAVETKKPPQPINKEAVSKGVEAAAPPAVKTAIQPADKKAKTARVTVNRQEPTAAIVPHREKGAMVRDSQTREAKETTASTRTATPPLAEPAKGAGRKTSLAAALQKPQSSGVYREAKREADRKADGLAPAAIIPPPVKAEGEPRPQVAEGMGITIPPVSGDLKLEIAGKDDLMQRIKVVLLYREFPKSRRNRPMSKAEYRRFQTLTPKLVRTGVNVRQVVIEVANEGIYEFRVETGSEQEVEATFAVKLYDNSSRARTRHVGKRRVSNSDSIVKVLMPEGILWDDDSAFSGSIEDSESITKFDSDTGLVWKEYR